MPNQFLYIFSFQQLGMWCGFCLMKMNIGPRVEKLFHMALNLWTVLHFWLIIQELSERALTLNGVFAKKSVKNCRLLIKTAKWKVKTQVDCL